MAKEIDNLCAHADDLLAYLYNEMAPADRDGLELHLADCTACIDDFAELSQSRYPVYEWKQIEFEPLVTPPIVLPAASVSWFDKARAAFSFSPGYSFASAGFAAILFAVAVGYAVFVQESPDRDSIAVVEKIDPVPSTSPQRIPAPDPIAAVKKTDDVVTPRSTTTERQIEPVKSVERKAKNELGKVTQPPKKVVAVPVMSRLDDDEDDSLRLSDLFDDLDTSK